MVASNVRFLITCEHASRRVPPRYAPLFRGWQRRLKTHRGFDLGALKMARDLARAFHAPLVAARVTRLLVDLNRSPGHRDLHSEASRVASSETLATVIRDHYQPYRERVEALVDAAIISGLQVIHISSHSFTPRLDGTVRRADLGLLYDPARPGERALCARWKAAFRRVAPELAVRRNYPYEGRNDGLMTHLRRCHPPWAYVGIELEINQAIVVCGGLRWKRLRASVVAALHRAAMSEDDLHAGTPATC